MDHKKGWRDVRYRTWKGDCDRDEYPPAYFLAGDPALDNHEQLVRYIEGHQNRKAGQMWAGFCWRHGFELAVVNDYTKDAVPTASQECIGRDKKTTSKSYNIACGTSN